MELLNRSVVDLVHEVDQYMELCARQRNIFPTSYLYWFLLVIHQGKGLFWYMNKNVMMYHKSKVSIYYLGDVIWWSRHLKSPFFNSLFRLKLKQSSSKLHIIEPLWAELLMTAGFSPKMASNADNVSMSWLDILKGSTCQSDWVIYSILFFYF